MKSPFDITQWTDYVRGLADEETRKRMQSHLESDPDARRTVAVLRRVADVGAKDRQLEVPADALRAVHDLGRDLARRGGPREAESRSAENRPSLLEGLRRFSMSLTFDSAMTPAAAGVREAHSAHRQMFFELDDVAVELRYEPHATGGVVVGQLISLGDEAAALAGVEVLARRGDRVLARAATGAHGELSLDGLPARDVDLLFVLDDRCLEVSLPASDR